MVRKHHRVLSLILCLILAVSAICAGSVIASAATGDTVYVRLNNGWTKIYCYMWDDSIGSNANWPGVEMTNVEGNVYSYTLTNNFTKVIFTNGGNGSNQTADLNYAGNGQIYDLSSGSWSTYIENPTTATTATTATTPTQATTSAPIIDGTYTVYLKNTAGWSTVKCYMWNSTGDENAAWSGESMTNIGGDVWMYTASKEYANCIFNNGSTQTSDLTAKYGYIYDNSTNTWEVYDTSPIKVTAYSADPTSDVYVESAVTLSATANSTTGATVYYKFSVTNANGGTSVVSDYSTANSVIWTPSSAGTYTITFDFKDSNGNENSRTTTITVGDDSALVKPVIKSVVPTNFGLIKVNSTATVTVKAGGGVTGTNLLFYKYIVKDPNGVENIPYYTLNNTYSFTPTMAGTYTVNVYVQGSDNSTVNKTYTYTATTSNITEPTTAATIPTTVPVTTVPPTTVPVTTVPATTEPTDPTTAVILGDVDGDGRVSVKDATYIQKHVVDYEGFETVDLAVGDVDGDGRITVKDATEIQKMI